MAFGMLVLGEASSWLGNRRKCQVGEFYIKKEGELLVGARNLYNINNAGDKNVLLN